MKVQSTLAIVVIGALALLPVAPLARANRTPLSSGVNMFSPQQDIELGRQNAAQAEAQIPMLNDARVDRYLNDLGRRLAAHAPGYKFPYEYRCVNDGGVNAFALPGGHVYVNRGTIEMADNEAQLAGVLAHETSHVALRHGTNQATKSQFASIPLAILGGMLGNNSVAGLVAQLGAGFSLNSILLKYSRNDESQADVMGTQILYDTGYDPRAMAQFFEKLNSVGGGKQPMAFFSDHPSPSNRVGRVDQEVDNLGGVPQRYQSDSPAFQDIKRYLRSLPPPPKARSMKSAGANPGRPGPPSTRVNTFQNEVLDLRYPDNWKSSASGSTFALMPPEGVVSDGSGNSALAYGLLFNSFDPADDMGGPDSLEEDSNELVASMSKSNRNLRAARRWTAMRVDGSSALATNFSNASPQGGVERGWIITVERPEGLYYFVCVAPESDFSAFEGTFQEIIRSVRFRR